MFTKTISASLSPNSFLKDAWTAASYLLLPWKWGQWKQGKYPQKFENTFQETINTKHAITFDSGRGALYAILQAMGIGQGDEVILQTFTCIVVPNAIFFVGATPVFCDIDANTLNIDAEKIEALITPRTKAIILQHTFGKPGPIDQILQIAQKHHLKVIEDCAHSLGSTYQERPLGSFGDAALFSLGRDKVISAVHGGLATTHNAELAEKLRAIQSSISSPRATRLFQHLMHPIAFQIILPLYNRFSIGKILLVLLQKIQIISKVFVSGEKQAIMPHPPVSRLANCLAELACHQLTKLETFNRHRLKIAELYNQELRDIPGLTIAQGTAESEKCNHYRYSILSPHRVEIMKAAKQAGFLLGDWYDPPIAPKDAHAQAVGYRGANFPVAAAIARQVINLPTHPKINIKQARQLVNILKHIHIDLVNKN